MNQVSIASTELWLGFGLLIVILLAFDLVALNRSSRPLNFHEALRWTLVCIGITLSFNVFLYIQFGQVPALEFLTGYVIEYSLSVDNLFVFLVIFSYFNVPEALQRRVLLYGILGAVVMRGIFIAVGAQLLVHFHWIIYIFGIILIASGVKLLFQTQDHVQPDKNIVYRFFKNLFPIAKDYHGERFFIYEQGKLFATPLFLVLVSVEVTDLVFALDSIPAIFAITLDPFIVFTSNIFAILGLRSLYFLLSSAIGKLEYLNVGLALVLAFVGVKMLISGFYHIPTGWSLGIIVSLIGGAVVASLLHKGEKK